MATVAAASRLVLWHVYNLAWLPPKRHTIHSQGSSATLTFCCDRALACYTFGCEFATRTISAHYTARLPGGY